MFSKGIKKEKRESDSPDTSHDRSQYSPIVQKYDWDFEQKLTQKNVDLFHYRLTEQEIFEFYEKWVGREDEMFDLLDENMRVKHRALGFLLAVGLGDLKNSTHKKQYKWYTEINSRFRPIQEQFQRKQERYNYLKRQAVIEEKLKQIEESGSKKKEKVNQKKTFSLLNRVKSVFSKIKTAFDLSSQSQQAQKEKKTEK